MRSSTYWIKSGFIALLWKWRNMDKNVVHIFMFWQRLKIRLFCSLCGTRFKLLRYLKQICKANTNMFISKQNHYVLLIHVIWQIYDIWKIHRLLFYQFFPLNVNSVSAFVLQNGQSMAMNYTETEKPHKIKYKFLQVQP